MEKNMELEEAIENIKRAMNEHLAVEECTICFTNDLAIILKELEKKDRIIELMAIELAEQFNHYEPCWLECEDNIKCDNQESCKECIKQYFKKKVEESE